MKVRKAVIPQRVSEQGFSGHKVVPKELLPIVDKPTIQYIMEEIVAAGIEEVILITGREKGSIEDHFDTSTELENHLKKKGREDLLKMVQEISEMVTLVSIRQKEPLGLGMRFSAQSEPWGRTFAVLLGDDLDRCWIPCIKQMIDVYQK
jgi:UTP--glucose-1-phosphate uridylyltransferase